MTEIVEEIARAIASKLRVVVYEDDGQGRFESQQYGAEIEGIPDAVCAAYEVMARSDGWLPIESAPKDGTRVLLWIEPAKVAMPFEWRDGRWMGDDYPLNMARPTFWRPLPDPPSTIKELSDAKR